jgi:hypothetical protein
MLLLSHLPILTAGLWGSWRLFEELALGSGYEIGPGFRGGHLQCELKPADMAGPDVEAEASTYLRSEPKRKQRRSAGAKARDFS